MLLALIIALAATATESHPTHHTHPLAKRNYPNGIATFNDYAAQGNTNCGPASGQHGTYGAAASDIAPDISGGTCSGSVLMSQCAGQSAAPGYQAPGCPKKNCGKCYKVTNKGGIGGSVGGVGNSITVQIIDACPASSAHNFCKTDTPANSRCGDAGTNQLDIDHSAYMALTGKPYGGGPNLNIGIEDADCLGGTSTGDSTQGSAVGAAPVPSSSDDLAPGKPGQHAAGGDKLAQHRVSNGNLAIQDFGSPDAPSPSSSSSGPAPPPPPPTGTSSVVPATTSITPSGGPDGGAAMVPAGQPQSGGSPEEEDVECDEL